MSDLIGGGPSVPTGNGRRGNGGPEPPPGTTGSPSGIKGPREIMRERAAREAQKRAEQDRKAALERSRAEDEARLIDAERRRRAVAAGAAQRGSGEPPQRTSGGSNAHRISDQSQRTQRTSGGSNPPLTGVGQGGRAVGGDNAGGSRPRPAQTQSASRPIQAEPITHPRPEPTTTTTAGPSATQPTGTVPPQTRSSFPHAFERWESLSAHWEGLTSFWIRKLESNATEVDRDPLSQQISRQVIDLSAAGANLFHAVVELQRLRASSERKFQRWFFETRAEQERAQEIQATTAEALAQERNERMAAIEDAVAKEREKNNSDKQLAEMRRELQISKEEARRAWDELGRREEEERERTASLRDGQPTLVGGVQVVPMMQGVPSRHESAREAPQTRDTYPRPSGSRTQQEAPEDESGYTDYIRSQRETTDPFISTTSPPSSRQQPAASYGGHPAFTNSSPQGPAPAVQPAATTTGYYQQHSGTPVQHSESEIVQSEGAFSDDEYEIDSQGQFILDRQGNKVRYRAPASDEEDDDRDGEAYAQGEQKIANLSRYGANSQATATGGMTSPTQVPPSVPTVGQPVDYSGQGYGGAPAEWAAVTRHHHPTRLSDVLEEDERSRTSASQLSRRTEY